MVFDPRWPWHAAVALNAKLEIAAPYWRCVPGSEAHRFSAAPHPWTRPPAIRYHGDAASTCRRPEPQPVASF